MKKGLLILGIFFIVEGLLLPIAYLGALATLGGYVALLPIVFLSIPSMWLYHIIEPFIYSDLPRVLLSMGICVALGIAILIYRYRKYSGSNIVH